MIPTWYLIRHALATRSTSGYGSDILTASILPDTIPAIQNISRYLLTITESVQYSSELLRCRQTAAIIESVTEKKFIYDPRQNEYIEHSDTHAIEEFVDFKKRIISFVHTTLQTESSHIIIVTHGAVIAAITHILTNGDFSKNTLLDYSPCGTLRTIRDQIVTNTQY